MTAVTTATAVTATTAVTAATAVTTAAATKAVTTPAATATARTHGARRPTPLCSSGRARRQQGCGTLRIRLLRTHTPTRLCNPRLTTRKSPTTTGSAGAPATDAWRCDARCMRVGRRSSCEQMLTRVRLRVLVYPSWSQAVHCLTQSSLVCYSINSRTVCLVLCLSVVCAVPECVWACARACVSLTVMNTPHYLCAYASCAHLYVFSRNCVSIAQTRHQMPRPDILLGHPPAPQRT